MKEYKISKILDPAPFGVLALTLDYLFLFFIDLMDKGMLGAWSIIFCFLHFVVALPGFLFPGKSVLIAISIFLFWCAVFVLYKAGFKLIKGN